MKQKLRVHHLLCIPLYQGSGYSTPFCDNMEQMIGELSDPKKKVGLVCEPDMICQGCPNLTSQNTCRDENNHVAFKDRKLLRDLNLEETEGEEKSFSEWITLVKKNMTKEIFEASCRNCRWFQEGLCSYEAWCEKSK
ncbi:MAG: DUF1284 domain-containing protein [Lachnospiraceae bacterium]|nr:DUF1284 domain-containing protein [Robinsoniella sp.]MDY3766463.1 DUF1284 domain-containing protein [Lachnospiraceae bacterium]